MPLPKGLAGAAAKMAVTKMIERGWLQEVDANLRRGEPLWRETGDGHSTTLVVTDAGLLAIGIAPVVTQTMAAIHKHAADAPAPKMPTPRAGTKQAMLIALLQRPEGATVGKIVAATSWQAHTARGAISEVLKKQLGLLITLEKVGAVDRSIGSAEVPTSPEPIFVLQLNAGTCLGRSKTSILTPRSTRRYKSDRIRQGGKISVLIGRNAKIHDGQSVRRPVWGEAYGMTAADKVFDGSIPHFYDTFMVPLIFQVYADDLVERIAKMQPLSVLETASGTGVVPRALAKRLSRGARYVVTDLNQPMIDHAVSKQPDDSSIERLQADALDLPFRDEEFDVVACQFGAMFFPDRPKGYAEARRVLKPGGSYFFSVWDKIENNELADIITREAAAIFPNNPPKFLARTPHGYFDPELIRADLKRSGFSDVVIEVAEKKGIAPSAAAAAKAYCHGTPLRKEIEERDPAMLGHVIDSATASIEAQFGNGPIVSKICALVVTATK